MTLNPFKCEKCELELQPENILLGVDNGNLIRVCAFCGNKIQIDMEEKNK